MSLAEPLVVPAVRIRLGGREVDTERLAAVRVRREWAAPAACELRFEEAAGADLGALAERLTPGAELELRVAVEHGLLFRGDVLTVEHRYAPGGLREVLLRAQDRSHRWRQDCRVRAFVDVSVGDVIGEVAGEVGLTADITEHGPRWPRFLQDGRSTLDLVSGLTERAGLRWQVDADGTRVHVTSSGPGRGEPLVLSYGDRLLEATVQVSAVAARQAWRVLGWDPVTGQIRDQQAPTETCPEALGDVTPGTGVRSGELLADDDHAEYRAQALGARSREQARTVRAVALGDPRLVPGVRVRLDGLAPTVSGTYVIAGVEHVIDAVAGYLCVISSEPPAGASASPPDAAHITMAEVVRVDDPEARGRVKVALSSLDGLETEWLPVLAVGAGADKGLTCQPDVGDHVVVTYEPLDPGRGVVLGTLRTEAGSEPATGVTDGTVGTYALRLPGGQSLRLAAERDAVTLTNTTGSRLILDADGVQLHAVGDLVVAAPGRRITLRARAIDLERG